VILQFSRDRGDGLSHVLFGMQTAGVVLIERGSGSESDLEDALDRSGYVRRGVTDRVWQG
jgi:thiamine phosphate synthase YjbQ (UPF0047 family)